jgi:molecular chaperone Hsp33
MSERDYLVRGTALNGRVRAFALNATALTAELQRRHDTWPGVTAALGRTAMGALLLAAASLKEEDQALTLEVKGDGPVRRLLATANGQGQVRGLAGNPHADAGVVDGKLNVGGVVGQNGFLSVSRDLGMRDTYSGTVELLSGEIGSDLAHYLARSEQTPSAVGLGVFVGVEGGVEMAGGYLVQVLGGLHEDELAGVEQRVAALPHPTVMLREGITPEGMLARIFPDGFEQLDKYPVSFHCPCSRARFEAAIVSLGESEIQGIIDADSGEATEVVCHFCNEAYHFSREEMEGILAAAR